MAAFPSSSIPMIIRVWVFLFLFGSKMADSSTLGLKYISGLLEIQDRQRAPLSLQLSAAYAALNRLIPSHSSSFHFNIVSKAYMLTLFNVWFLRFFLVKMIDITIEITYAFGVSSIEKNSCCSWYQIVDDHPEICIFLAISP